MIESNNKYTVMQREFFDNNAKKMAEGDHREHNDNPDYWDVLLSKIVDNPSYNGKIALDFGCGTGRNVKNLHFESNAGWARVDGVDISSNNIIEAEKEFKSVGMSEKDYKLYVNNGVDLSVLKSEEYDFVMSTIVLQHICVHEIRYSIMKEIYRVLKPGGLFSFQMGYGKSVPEYSVDYYANNYDATGTNSACDTRVESPDQLIKDLEEIGFKNIEYIIKNSWSNTIHTDWIFVHSYKI